MRYTATFYSTLLTDSHKSSWNYPAPNDSGSLIVIGQFQHVNIIRQNIRKNPEGHTRFPPAEPRLPHKTPSSLPSDLLLLASFFEEKPRGRSRGGSLRDDDLLLSGGSGIGGAGGVRRRGDYWTRWPAPTASTPPTSRIGMLSTCSASMGSPSSARPTTLPAMSYLPFPHCFDIYLFQNRRGLDWGVGVTLSISMFFFPFLVASHQKLCMSWSVMFSWIG